MGLVHLDVTHFRNLISAKCTPLLGGFNFIYGNNGSGKTSLLEAIYYLGFGRSFRSSISERIIHHSADKFSIFAHLAAKSADYLPIGLERHQTGGIKMRIDGRDIRSVAEFANLTPVQLIDSHCHSLLESGPAFRRKYLDWAIFHCVPDFLRVWRRYDRALQQRNAALRAQVSKREIDSWTKELIESGKEFNQFREEYAGYLALLLEKTVKELLNLSSYSVTYERGWDDSCDYAEVLASSFGKDNYLGYTQFGPHKADLKIKINQVPAKDILSRGQQKLFVCAMIIARGTLLEERANKRSIYLVDDLPSELDLLSRTRLIALLSRQDAQIFVTAVEREDEKCYLAQRPMKMFHVEHGCVTEV